MSVRDPLPGGSGPTPSVAGPDAGPKGRGSRFTDGLKSVGRAVWFVFSMVLYAAGLVLFYAGRGLIKISGWSSDATEATPGTSSGAGSPPPDPTRLR